MQKFVAAILILISLSITTSYAGQSSCPENFFGGSAPEALTTITATKNRLLCNEGYAVGHSGYTRTPLWAAEKLTREKLAEGRGKRRTNDFRPDERLPANERAELEDYSRSGYDRGHQVPAADVAGNSSTFLLSNMIRRTQTTIGI